MSKIAMDWIYGTLFKDPFCYACDFDGRVWDIYLHPIVGFEIVENGKISHGFMQSLDDAQELVELTCESRKLRKEIADGFEEIATLAKQLDKETV